MAREDDLDFSNDEEVHVVGRKVLSENTRVAPEPEEDEYEVVDDTPEEDQGRPALALDEDDPEQEEELESYSKRVKKRIDRLTHKMNDERREKERLAREHAEAVKIAQMFYNRAQELENTVTWGAGRLNEESTSRLDYQQQIAQDKYRKAFEAGDTDGVIEAQNELNKLAIERSQIGQWTPPVPQAPKAPLQQENIPVYNQTAPVQPQQPPARDYKAESWASQNPWFGKDEEMTAFAYGVHERLVKSGVDPTSDEYYGKVDARMREMFPQNFNQRTKKVSAVASVGRTTAPKKTAVTKSEDALIKRLGIKPEAYLAEKRKLEQRNG
jgi:hypothetical protein